ncbi:hypothetical protein A2W24_04490 [Microgenomates group bacterium RBG_16_45_19]|nr:MAG: hypothetical protein A2W24_04490 [Microgenomates group bacterium RBG_16_45_19]
MSRRLSQLRRLFLLRQLDGLVISKPTSLTYLTGLKQLDSSSREAFLLVTSTQAHLYHSPFLTPPPHPWLKTISMSPTHTFESTLSAVFSTINHQSPIIGFEAHHLTVAEHRRLHSALPQAKLEPTTDLVETLRLIKDPSEIKAIHQACASTRRTMTWLDRILGEISTFSEFSLARLIETKLYDFGADAIAFPPIVAFGSHAALPHHLPDKTKLAPPTVVLLDFGGSYHGYAADISRTFYLGTPPPRFLEIETIVHSAYTATLNLLRSQFSLVELTGDKSRLAISPRVNRLSAENSPGVMASDIDAAARAVIAKAGFGEYYIHSSGHGIGLEIHESPSLNANNHTPLKAGMVITLEPGIYLPHEFGYRHENTLLLS